MALILERLASEGGELTDCQAGSLGVLRLEQGSVSVCKLRAILITSIEAILLYAVVY